MNGGCIRLLQAPRRRKAVLPARDRSRSGRASKDRRRRRKALQLADRRHRIATYSEIVARGYWRAFNIVEISTADTYMTAGCTAGATKIYLNSDAGGGALDVYTAYFGNKPSRVTVPVLLKAAAPTTERRAWSFPLHVLGAL